MNDIGYMLALDVGERRIGVALASDIARLAAPLKTIDRLQTSAVFEAIAGLVRDHQVKVVVVGLPRDMSGQETEQTALSRGFARELAAHVSVPIVMQDEAVTSQEAERILKARGKPYDKADIDAQAAALILQDYIQAQTEHAA